MCTKGYQISAHRFHILTEINLEFLRKLKKNCLQRVSRGGWVSQALFFDFGIKNLALVCKRWNETVWVFFLA